MSYSVRSAMFIAVSALVGSTASAATTCLSADSETVLVMRLSGQTSRVELESAPIREYYRKHGLDFERLSVMKNPDTNQPEIEPVQNGYRALMMIPESQLTFVMGLTIVFGSDGSAGPIPTRLSAVDMDGKNFLIDVICDVLPVQGK